MHRRSPWILAALLLSCTLSCTGSRVGTDDGLGDGIDPGSGSDEGVDGMPADEPRLDVLSGEDEGPAEGGDPMDLGCRKVDLLFVIDNSGSMSDEQDNLVNSFPAFIDEIQAQLENTDSFHIGIVTSDLYAYDEGCDQQGAMVIATGGRDSSKSTCGPYVEGHRYMTEMDNLDESFACAARVGTGGSIDERPIEIMSAALSPSMTGAEGCNAGFLRDDALLVIVMITDEEDDHEVDACKLAPQSGSPGEPDEWFADLIAIKTGVEKNIVVLALVGPPGPNPPACPALDKCVNGITGAEVAERLVSFTSMFTHGIVGRVCEASYAEFFADAVSVIDSACDDFAPIG